MTRLRAGTVHKDPGYDGEYGVIRLFGPGELAAGGTLFEVPGPVPAPPRPSRTAGCRHGPASAGRRRHRTRAAGIATKSWPSQRQTRRPGRVSRGRRDVQKEGARGARPGRAPLDGLDPEQWAGRHRPFAADDHCWPGDGRRPGR